MNKIRMWAAALMILAISTIAYAAGKTQTYRFTSDGTGVAAGSVLPGPTAIGIPLHLAGDPLKSVTVTIADFRDGGANDLQQVGNGRLIALIAKNGVRDPDGGIQWARYPAFDVEVDGGNPFIPGGGGAVTYSLQLNSAALGLGMDGKLLFYSQAVIAADGGALPHNVLIEGHY